MVLPTNNEDMIMRLNIKEITELLNVNVDVAEKIEYYMQCFGLNFSQCTKSEFNSVAHMAYAEYLEAESK